MTDPEVPAEVQSFLREHIESYEQLEILLLLSADPTRSWTPDDAAAELRTSENLAEAALRSLCRAGLLGVDIGDNVLLFRYATQRADLADAVVQLATAYEQSRLEIMRLMTANAIGRLRVGAVTTFADTFLLRRRKRPNG